VRIIPAGLPRVLRGGIILASFAIGPAVVEARQDAAVDPPAATRPRGDGWKPKSTAAAEDGGADPAPIPGPTAGRAGERPAESKAGVPAPGGAREGSGARVPAKPSAEGPGRGAATRTLSSAGGQTTLAAEKAAVDDVTAKTTIDEILAVTLPPRGDRAGDWSAGPEPLHRCGEPRWIEPCIPPPPCHPSLPPAPFDLVGVAGEPTAGPIYRGPCCPRTGTRDDGPWPHVHRVGDRLFDAFYRTK